MYVDERRSYRTTHIHLEDVRLLRSYCVMSRGKLASFPAPGLRVTIVQYVYTYVCTVESS